MNGKTGSDKKKAKQQATEQHKALPASIFNMMLAHKDCYVKNERKFRHIFGIGMWQFQDLLMGFDILKFDDWLKTPDGISTADYLTEKYGTEARDLVKRLISA